MDRGIGSPGGRFLPDVAKMARNLKVLVPYRLHDPQIQDPPGPTSEYRRENPTGPRHIRAIAVAKGLQHHSLFPCDAAKEQNPKTDQARKAGDPIRQKQSLGNSPEPKCRIHRVSNSPVNPVCHEFMILAHVEADGPIPAERTVRQVKHTQSRNRKEKSEPSQRGMKAVSCETRHGCRYVDERHKSQSCKRCE